MMNGGVDETGHVVSLYRFQNTSTINKRYKEQKLNDIIAAICAMLNSKGGKAVLHIDTDSKDIPDKSQFLSSQKSQVIRILEQSIISVIGLRLAVSKISFQVDEKSINLYVKCADSLITTNYNLYLPSQSQVVQVSPLESPENVNNDILNRKDVFKPVILGSHRTVFYGGSVCGLEDNKKAQLKHLKADNSKRTRLADRMTGKGNKFICYVSAFANYNGGHIYYGITDDGVVEGEFISNEEDKSEITKKVGKVINKMIWPEQIGQPKRGEHWEIFFEPVVDENFNPIPSTFVIVIYIAPCLGGVFIEEPECYEMVDGRIEKMSFITWKERMMQPVWLNSRLKIPHTITRISWSSAKARESFISENNKLMQAINNGNWGEFSKKRFQIDEFLVSFRQVTACYRRGNLEEARTLLEQCTAILPQAKDSFILEVMRLYLLAAIERATGNIGELEALLSEVLSKTEMIKPGLVTAILYIFAGTVTDLIKSSPTPPSPDVFSIRALEHLRCVEDSADMRKKIFLTLATFYLGCNINGQRTHETVDRSCLDKAKNSIMAVHVSVCEEKPLSAYHEVQLNLVQSIYNYRHSQVNPDERTRLLRDALNYAKKAECLARDNQFTELVEWSKANEALCTEQLVRNALAFSARKRIPVCIPPENDID